MKRTALLLWVLFLLLPCLAHGEISVSLKLDRSKATLADTLTMTVSVSGSRRGHDEPVLNGLEDFTVTRGGTSSRLEIVNSQVNSGIDYTYRLQPKRTGTFQIGPAQVRVKGKIYQSNKEDLTVVRPAQAGENDRGPIFLTAEISADKVYVEEQVTYTLKLFRQARVSDISLGLPEAEHLSFKQLGKHVEYKSVHNGTPYQVLEVRYAVFPSKEGSYTIAPARMNLTVYRSSRRSSRGSFDDIFNDPFFSFARGEAKTLVSEPLELQVLQLPEAGRPADFSGLVGRFNIQSKLEPTTIKAGDSATLTVLLSGRGNVNRVPDLELRELDQVKTYGDEPVLEIQPDGKGMVGAKTMKWALVPEKEGLYDIPPLRVSFFDPGSRQYKVAETSPQTLTVLPGEAGKLYASPGGSAQEGAESPNKQTVKELGRDILPIHTSLKDLTTAHQARPGGLLFYLFLVMPVLVYGSALLTMKFQRKSVENLATTRARRAAKVFIKHTSQAGLTCNEMILYFRDYLNDRFHLTQGSVTADEAFEILRSNGVSSDAADKLRLILQNLENEIFTGRGHEPWTIGEDIAKLFKQIEREAR